MDLRMDLFTYSHMSLLNSFNNLIQKTSRDLVMLPCPCLYSNLYYHHTVMMDQHYLLYT